MTTVVSPVTRVQRPAPTSGYTAIALVAGALVLLWSAPPVGLPLAVAALAAGLPWGRRLSERALIAAAVVPGSAALVLAAAWVADAQVPTVFWPLALSVALVAVAAFIWGRERGSRWAGSAPLWPSIGWEDGIAALALLVILAAGLLPFAGASAPAILTALLSGWDHSSHLPMFIQTVQAQGWAAGDDVMFSLYPMLHTGLWTAAEAVLGHGPETVGADLVGRYVVWSWVTTAVAAALLVWSAALAARTFAASRSGRVAVTAAAITAGWCVLGSLTLMADFAFVNFLLASSLAVAAVVVGARSRRAVVSFGWFVLPLAGIAVMYLYPPMVGGIALASGVWLVALLRERSVSALAVAGAGAVAAVAMLPGMRFLTEPFQGRAVGDITGGIPNVEIVLGLVLAVVVSAALLPIAPRRAYAPIAHAPRRAYAPIAHAPRRAYAPIAHAPRLAMAAPIAATVAVGMLFAAQAIASGMPLSDSYYTKKVLYGLLLVSLPIAAALVSAVAADLLHPAFERTRFPMLATIGAATAVLAAASVLTAGAAPSGERESLTTVPMPPGAWSLVARAAGVRGDSEPGLAQLIAARSGPGWTGLVAMGSMSDVQSGRTAAGIGSTLTWRANDIVQTAHDDLEQLRVLMRRDRSVRVHWVLLDPREAPPVRGLIEEFGRDRVRMDIVGRW